MHPQQENNNRIGYRQAFLSLFLNFLLFGLKYWAGIVSGSLALIADAWHTLTDSVSSMIVMIAIWFSSRKPNHKHPFGFGRIEQLAALLIAFIIAIIAWEFLGDAVHRFRTQQAANFGTLALIVIIVSILIKEGLAQYTFRAARKTGLATLNADAWNHRSDALSSVVMLIGIFLGRYFWWIDSLLGVMVSILLFYAVYKIAREAVGRLLGQEPDQKLNEAIKSITLDIAGYDTNPHHFHLHDYGCHKELTFHIKVCGEQSILQGHTLAKKMELAIFEQTGITATIHIDPA
ncbi:MAG TPA: cation diffusion facilitator family transporter [Bacteroidales bacterium]|nr:cation diffusion facilitator family transporter [Bacteroidales bacterium]